MQHAWIDVKRPGGSHTALDEKCMLARLIRTPFPTYVCLPSGLYKARTGHIVAQTGPEQEILPLPGIYFFDGWRIQGYLLDSRMACTREDRPPFCFAFRAG